MKTQVCAIVINSVSHDARVLKEAASLHGAGYDVSVVGIQDANESAPFDTLDSGIKIYRVAWQARTAKPGYLGYIIVFAALVAALSVLWSLSGDDFAGGWRSFGGYIGQVFRHIVGSPILTAIQVSVTAGLLYLGWRCYKAYRARRATYSNLRQREVAVQLPFGEGEDRADARGWRLKRLPRRLFLLCKFPAQFGLISRQVTIMKRERAIAEFCIMLAPDIVHCHDIGALPIGERVKKATGCKLVFDAHEIYDQIAQTSSAERALNRHIAHHYGDQVDAFVTINDSIATYYRRNFPFLPRPVVIRNAVHKAQAFEYDGRLHEAAGLAPDIKILLYQGGFARHRGLIQLVQSASMLPKGWMLVMMGWGRLEGELLRAARIGGMQARKTQRSRYYRAEGLPSRVRFVGRAPQEELARWSAGATIGVIPYENIGLNHWFCTPNKLWEYPNAGVPILASPFPEMRAVIEGYDIGWMLPLRLTPEGIATTVAKITDDQVATATANCRRFVEEDNWVVYEDRLVNMYRDLANGRQEVFAPALLPTHQNKAAA